MYYRWHPFFGMSLPVHKRRKSSSGERVSCQLPDGTLCSVPSWMLRPECAHFSFGSPLISVEALCELRNLVAAWQAPSNCGKALLKSPAKEGGDETIAKARTQPPRTCCLLMENSSVTREAGLCPFVMRADYSAARSGFGTKVYDAADG